MRGEPVDRRANHPLPAAARRIAQRRPAVQAATGARTGGRVARAPDTDSRGRPRTANGSSAPFQAGAPLASGRLGNRRQPAADESQRLPDLARRGDPGAGTGTGLAANRGQVRHAAAHRWHLVRSRLHHCRLWESRRPGTRAWFGPGPGVHPRRRSPGRNRWHQTHRWRAIFHPIGATDHSLADGADQLRAVV
ncbi:hypothetical protein D9M69_486810 [compost metagenome]